MKDLEKIKDLELLADLYEYWYESEESAFYKDDMIQEMKNHCLRKIKKLEDQND